jgi:hypothetical protein
VVNLSRTLAGTRASGLGRTIATLAWAWALSWCGLGWRFIET